MVGQLSRQQMKLAPHANQFGAFLKEDSSEQGVFV
jgi:hypothetical protein